MPILILVLGLGLGLIDLSFHPPSAITWVIIYDESVMSPNLIHTPF